MDKYIKLEDAIHNINLEVIGRKEYTGDMKANLFFALDALPTIEVSEEVLKATKNFNAYTIADENAEMGMRTQIEPIIEVSEDAISREYLKSFEYINKGDFNSVETIREWIDNAPSVVPSCQKNRQVERAEGEWIFKGNSIDPIWNCSECGKQIICSRSELPNYCEDCGAEMKV